jgi:hypothetical protein
MNMKGGGHHASPRSWPIGNKVYKIDLEADKNYDQDWLDVKKIQMLSLASGSRYRKYKKNQ